VPFQQEADLYQRPHSRGWADDLLIGPHLPKPIPDEDETWQPAAASRGTEWSTAQPHGCPLPMRAFTCLPGESSGPRRAEPRGRSILDREVQVGPGPGPTESPHRLAPGHVPSARGVIRVLGWTQIGPKGVQFSAVNGRDRQ
jgi:hypothetical protein